MGVPAYIRIRRRVVDLVRSRAGHERQEEVRRTEQIQIKRLYIDINSHRVGRKIKGRRGDDETLWRASQFS